MCHKWVIFHHMIYLHTSPPPPPLPGYSLCLFDSEEYDVDLMQVNCPQYNYLIADDCLQFHEFLEFHVRGVTIL